MEILKKEQRLNRDEVERLNLCIDRLEIAFVWQKGSLIKTLLKVLHGVEMESYFDEGVERISSLYSIIIHIDSKYKLAGFEQTGTELGTIKKYFETMSNAFNSQEGFSYAREELMYFVKEITLMVKCLEIWFGESTLLIHKQDKSIREMKGVEDVDSVLKELEYIKSVIYNLQDKKELINAFIEMLFEIDKIIVNNPTCYGERKRKS